MSNENNDLQYITDQDDEKRHLKLHYDVINTYMDQIKERSPEVVYALNTFFFYLFIL